MSRSNVPDPCSGGSFEEVMREWTGSHAAIRYDVPSGAWMFVAMHDTALGVPTGGCRLRVYPTPAAGLRDALRLAEGMTYKWAAVDFPFGGGKSVIAAPEIPSGREREAVFRRFGRFLEDLQGAYYSGEDLGTTPEDMAVVAEETSHILGVVGSAPPRPVDPGPHTARGVMAAMKAGLRHVFESESLSGRRVVVQGIGDVGAPLARLVAREGGVPVLTDPDEARVEALRRELLEAGGQVEEVPAERAYEVDADVFAPCAVGGVLEPETVGRLEARLVAGSANNQLASDEVATLLLERGVAYVPDFLANAGGAIAFGMIREEAAQDAIRARVEAIGTTVADVLTEAARRGESPLVAARRRADRVLEAARDRASGRSAGFRAS